MRAASGVLRLSTGLRKPVDRRLSSAFNLKGIRHAQMAVARQIKPTPAEFLA
jgi:hypothetical protein